MTACLGCKAEIGPTEAPDCPTHRGKRGLHLTHGDMAVCVLEASHGPVSLYDVHRGIQREFGWAPGRMSLNATISLDRRCCWAGRGLYGLWRHGFVPGPRKLEDLARLVLYSHELALGPDELGFALRHLGYRRFQQVTLYRVLTSSATIKRADCPTFRVNRSPAGGAELRARLGLSPDAFRLVTETTGKRTRSALRERKRRLASDRGLAYDDPVYDEGELNDSTVY